MPKVNYKKRAERINNYGSKAGGTEEAPKEKNSVAAAEFTTLLAGSTKAVNVDNESYENGKYSFDEERYTTFDTREEAATDAMWQTLWANNSAYKDSNGNWRLNNNVTGIQSTKQGYTVDGQDYFKTREEAATDAMWQTLWASNKAYKDNSGAWKLTAKKKK